MFTGGAMIMMAKGTFELAFDNHSLIVSFDHRLLHALSASYFLTAIKVDRLMSGRVELIVAQGASEINLYRLLLWGKFFHLSV